MIKKGKRGRTKNQGGFCKGGAGAALIQIELAAGGAFGVESSLAAAAGYLLVIILSLVNLKRKC